MLKLCPGSMSMSTLCQGYVNGVCLCWRYVKGDYSVHVEIMSREYVHVDVMSKVCQGRRSMSTLVATFLCKTYILYFINKMRIHVDGYVNGVCPCLRIMSREILSMLTLFQGSRSIWTLCQGYVTGGGHVSLKTNLV